MLHVSCIVGVIVVIPRGFDGGFVSALFGSRDQHNAGYVCDSSCNAVECLKALSSCQILHRWRLPPPWARMEVVWLAPGGIISGTTFTVLGAQIASLHSTHVGGIPLVDLVQQRTSLANVQPHCATWLPTYHVSQVSVGHWDAYVLPSDCSGANSSYG